MQEERERDKLKGCSQAFDYSSVIFERACACLTLNRQKSCKKKFYWWAGAAGPNKLHAAAATRRKRAGKSSMALWRKRKIIKRRVIVGVFMISIVLLAGRWTWIVVVLLKCSVYLFGRGTATMPGTHDPLPDWASFSFIFSFLTHSVLREGELYCIFKCCSIERTEPFKGERRRHERDMFACMQPYVVVGFSFSLSWAVIQSLWWFLHKYCCLVLYYNSGSPLKFLTSSQFINSSIRYNILSLFLVLDHWFSV